MANMNIGKNIKKIRDSKGLTLDVIASKLGVTAATVQRYETGAIKRIPYERIVAIAEILKVTPNELMGMTQENSKPSDDVVYSTKSDIPSSNSSASVMEYISKMALLSEKELQAIFSVIDCMVEGRE